MRSEPFENLIHLGKRGDMGGKRRRNDNGRGEEYESGLYRG